MRVTETLDLVHHQLDTRELSSIEAAQALLSATMIVLTLTNRLKFAIPDVIPVLPR